MVYLAYAFALLISFVLPIVVSAVLILKSRHYFKVILIGILTFLVFQVFTRVYILQEILPTQVWYILFTYQFPILYAFLLSLSAGLFEELGRYITMKYLLRNMNIKDSIVFGIGHGGIEAILFVGISLLMINPFMIDSQNLLMSGIERLSAMVFHCGFSLLVYQMIYKHKKHYLIFSIGIHTLINFMTVFLMIKGVNLWIVEGVLFSGACIMFIYIKNQWRNEYETHNPST